MAWGVSLLALVSLFGVWVAVGLGEPEAIAWEGRLPIRDLADPGEEEAALEAIRYTETFRVEGPTIVRARVRREAQRGWLGVLVSLVAEESGGAREARIELLRSNVDEVRFDRVPSGTYSVRFVGAWDARGEEALEPAPPAVHARVEIGGRPAYEPFVVGALLLLPAVIGTLRQRLARHRRIDGEAAVGGAST